MLRSGKCRCLDELAQVYFCAETMEEMSLGIEEIRRKYGEEEAQEAAGKLVLMMLTGKR